MNMGLCDMLTSIFFLVQVVVAVHRTHTVRRQPETSIAQSSTSVAATQPVSSWVDLPRSSQWARPPSYGRARSVSSAGKSPATFFHVTSPNAAERHRITQSASSQGLLRNIRNQANVNTPSLATSQRQTGFPTLDERPGARLTTSLSRKMTMTNLAKDKTESRRSNNNNVLMLLLNSRATSSRSIEEEIAISKHLLLLGSLKNSNSLSADKILQLQLNYIEAIAEVAIRRETLKLFVKDIVEKSGFLASSVDQSTLNTDELINLVAMIGKISDRFDKPQNQVDTNVNIHGTGTIRVTPPTGVVPFSTDSMSGSGQTGNRPLSRERIASALFEYQRGPQQDQVPDLSTLNNKVSSFKSRWHGPSGGVTSTIPRASVHSPILTERDRIRLMVGQSIYGNQPVPSFRPTPPTTLPTLAPTTMRAAIKREPVGGNDGYWTHLRSGLADLLCRLCQQRQNDACISRYCNNQTGFS